MGFRVLKVAPELVADALVEGRDLAVHVLTGLPVGTRVAGCHLDHEWGGPDSPGVIRLILHHPDWPEVKFGRDMPEAEVLLRKIEVPKGDHGTHRIECLCPGCRVMIPGCWQAGMCVACLNEACEHEEASDV